MPPTPGRPRPGVSPEPRAPTDRTDPDPAFLWRVARALGIAVAVGLGLLLLIYATEVLLLAFASVLLAVFLRTPADWLTRRTGLWPGLSLALVALLIVAGFVAVGWFTFPRLVEQAGQFAEQAERAVQTLDGWLGNAGLSLEGLMPPAETIVGRLPGVVTMTFGALASLLVILVAGLYMASRPEVYVDGFVRLFAVERRQQARAVLGEVGHVLQRWLAGQLLAMMAVGALTFTGLMLLGVPLAFGLAVLAGLLEFVPYLGPIVAAVPALLVGLAQDGTTAFYVLLLYFGVQQAESYLITPLIQRRAVYLPPALIILFQVLMGVLFGIVGIILATPLAAVALVLVQRVYLDGLLGDDTARRDDDGA